jgi:hypothetical protein
MSQPEVGGGGGSVELPAVKPLHLGIAPLSVPGGAPLPLAMPSGLRGEGRRRSGGGGAGSSAQSRRHPRAAARAAGCRGRALWRRRAPPGPRRPLG